MMRKQKKNRGKEKPEKDWNSQYIYFFFVVNLFIYFKHTDTTYKL